ncbi:MAG TPA: dockerin type I domain-containing protein [Bacteroidales bacterium]
MKKHLLFVAVCLMLYQTFCSDSGKTKAENAVPDTLSWTWEVSSTVSTRTKTCTFEFSDNLLVNWGDGVTEWIPDSLSSKTITHAYTVQANYNCTAIGVGISYFKADSRRVLNLDVRKAPGLTYLSCTSNQIGSLDLTGNVQLVSLYCGSNSLKTLDMKSNLNLQTLTCSDNQLSTLDCTMLPVLKKVTCHTNPLIKIGINSTGLLSYLSCSGCSLTAESLDSIFVKLPALPVVSTSKNLYVLSNPGSSSCHSEIAAAKNWMLDRVITQSSFYLPSVSCKSSDSIRATIYLKNTAPAIAFELDVLIPEGFVLDTLRSCLSSARKGQHVLSVARLSDSSQTYKIMAYSLKNKDSFSGADGAVLELYMKAAVEMKTYTLDIQKAILMDTLTNVMDLSVTDGQMTVGASSLVGDANGDGKVDVTDIVNLVAWINGKRSAGMNSAAMDINGDGLWNIVDITKLVVIINSGGTLSRSESESSMKFDIGDLSLYLADEAPLGNNFFVRQAANDASSLEICLDNMDNIQAFQADLLLPEGLSLQEGEFSQQTERNSGQTFSICKVSENRYRLLSYAMKADAAFSGKSGELARIQLKGTENLSDGAYPIVMQQPVLTGMDLQSVSLTSYDAVFILGKEAGKEEPISFGTTDNSRLWVKGHDLLTLTVWDMAGKLMLQKKLDHLDNFSVVLAKGSYLVKASTGNIQGRCQKVAVK